MRTFFRKVFWRIFFSIWNSWIRSRTRNVTPRLGCNIFCCIIQGSRYNSKLYSFLWWLHVEECIYGMICWSINIVSFSPFFLLLNFRWLHSGKLLLVLQPDSGNDGGNSNGVVARTFLIRTKTEEDRNKLAAAIQEYTPAAWSILLGVISSHCITFKLKHELQMQCCNLWIDLWRSFIVTIKKC